MFFIIVILFIWFFVLFIFVNVKVLLLIFNIVIWWCGDIFFIVKLIGLYLYFIFVMVLFGFGGCFFKKVLISKLDLKFILFFEKILVLVVSFSCVFLIW